MKRVWVAMLIGSLACLGSSGQLLGQSTTQPADNEDEIEYRPPPRGASAARIGGGSRNDRVLPNVVAIVPEHVGLTLSATPTLYWYCSAPADLPVEFALNDDNTLENVVRKQVTAKVEAAGWQRISLSDLGIELKPEVPYSWNVALVVSTANRAENALAGGSIMRVSTDSAMMTELSGAAPLRRASLLARNGIWYDAVAALMEHAATNAQAANAQLAELLKQVSLNEAAKFASDAGK